MKNLKTTILTALFALCCFTNVNAQGGGRASMNVSVGKSLLSIGGGLSSPSSEAKDKAFLSNRTAINADLFLPILKKEGASYNFGINIGGTYSFSGSTGLGTLPNPYLVSGQTSNIVSDRGGEPAPGFRMGAGPQANFYLGKFIVSPMVLGEYFTLTQNEKNIVQTTIVGGQSYDFALASLPETKTSGFAVTPKLRLHYMFNERFGLFADASYTMGPKAETVIRKLIPNGAPNTPTNDYDLQALQTANFENGKTKSTALNSMGFNFGVVLGFGDRVNAGKTGIKIGGASEMPNKTASDFDHKWPKNKTTDLNSGDDIKKGWNGLADATEELEPTTPNNARTINNCCNATVTGSIQWDVPGAGFTLVTATPSLGSHSMTSISAGITFNSTINCLAYSGCIDPLPIVYKVNGVIYGTVANTTSFIIPASAFPTPGGYTITVIGKCGGIKCKAKKMQITIY